MAQDDWLLDGCLKNSNSSKFVFGVVRIQVLNVCVLKFPKANPNKAKQSKAKPSKAEPSNAKPSWIQSRLTQKMFAYEWKCHNWNRAGCNWFCLHTQQRVQWHLKMTLPLTSPSTLWSAERQIPRPSFGGWGKTISPFEAESQGMHFMCPFYDNHHSHDYPTTLTQILLSTITTTTTMATTITPTTTNTGTTITCVNLWSHEVMNLRTQGLSGLSAWLNFFQK